MQDTFERRVQEEMQEYEAGRFLFEQKKVKTLSLSASEMHFTVLDDPKRDMLFSINEPAFCSCKAFAKRGMCRHIVAASYAAEQTDTCKAFIKKKATEAAPQLMDALEEALPLEENVKLEVTLFFYREKSGVACGAGLRIGQERFYVVRDIAELLIAIKEKKALSFGKGFELQPGWMRFSQEDQNILQVFEYFCQRQRKQEGEKGKTYGRIVQLPDSYVRLLLSRLEGTAFRVAVADEIYELDGIAEKELLFHYQIIRETQGLGIQATWDDAMLPLSEQGEYLWLNGKIVKTQKKQRKIIQLLLKNNSGKKAYFSFPLSQTSKVISEVVPWLSLTGIVEVDASLQKKVVKVPVEPKLYLDQEGKQIIANLIFTYADTSINPFAAQENEAPLRESLIVRNMELERTILEELENAGFRVGKEHIYLKDEKAIYNFISEGIGRLAEYCEIFASKQFKKLTPKKPVLRAEMALKNNRLEISFFEDEAPTKEILEIFYALRQKKDYFRLKDGSFLDLKELGIWNDIAQEITEDVENTNDFRADKENDNTITLSNYKTLYMNALLEHTQAPVQVNEAADKAVNCFYEPKAIEIPKGLKATLRSYQQKGLSWLTSIWELKMGGVLADEMGLGKTLQVIALIAWLKEHEKEKKPALVITPTSLCFNWQAEVRRYAPNLKVTLLHGSQSVRMAQLKQLQKEECDADVIITSYPLVRRDVDYLEKMLFSLVVVDEAQYIKNPSSIGALAVKRLKGDVRLALTGTPMENHVGELWSIIDFVMPGYLSSYNQFMKKYGDGKNAEDLKRKITPFLLRRLKKDVLQELPDKIETTLIAQMPVEQHRAYQASLLRLRGKMDYILDDKGFQKGQMEVLAAITELRQMCCHPALLLPEYSGSSGKLDLLMDIVPPMIESGHRILLFSQFTSMLKIIKRNLEAQGIDCLYLDGETKAQNRLVLADDFNLGKASVFLISLKAGGTGLNLIGADTVIHYDPWWNPAAEDQATDRAHRIGQKKKVEVIRLLTHESIEEQVAKLSHKKQELFDQLITAAEQMPTKLSKEDIRALFA